MFNAANQAVRVLLYSCFEARLNAGGDRSNLGVRLLEYVDSPEP